MVEFFLAKSYTGIVRIYKFRQNGEPEGDPSINIYQIKGGKINWLGVSSDIAR